MEKIRAHLISGKISTNSSDAKSLSKKSGFGEISGEKVDYSLFETLYLIEKNYLKLEDSKGKEITKKELEKKLNRLDKKFNLKYIVFKDLRNKNYILKSALKFGADFRIYEKGKKLGKGHSKWICFIAPENKSFNWHEFSSKNRVAHSTNKKLLIAIVDEENKISYFENSWIKP